jgi:hypothetical protein
MGSICKKNCRLKKSLYLRAFLKKFFLPTYCIPCNNKFTLTPLSFSPTSQGLSLDTLSAIRRVMLSARQKGSFTNLNGTER